MLATGSDGLNRVVPLAIGLYSSESKETWSAFLHKLKEAIPQVADVGMILMHDRDKGLQPAQQDVLPGTHESACARHLENNVVDRFKSRFGGSVIKAAKTTEISAFDKTMDCIRKEKEEAYLY